jgi:polygalacturonase
MSLFRAALFAAASLATARAQDTRQVAEPKLPPACATLKAQLRSVDGRKTLADMDESKPDTVRIQRAIDGCPTGQAVALLPDGVHDAFLSGPLELRDGVTLLVGAGAILFASRNPRDYDVAPGACGVVDRSGRGCRPLVAAAHVRGAGVMGDGIIDGRGWAHLTGRDVSWWDLAEQARTPQDARQNCPRLIVASQARDFMLYRVALRNSPNFHVTFSGDGFTAWGVTIDSPKNARNTDGIDPGNATNVTITRCFIHTGDDQVAIKAGTPGPTSHITVAHNHFYTGHGMSIGSETDGGASDILVSDLSIDGADNGIRIKSNSSRGGLVRHVVYEDVCIRDTKAPVYMDSNYAFYGAARDRLPEFTDIVLRNVRVQGGGKIILEGYDERHRLGITFDNVMLDRAANIRASHAEVTLGPGAVNFRPAGADVRVSGSPGKEAADTCEGRFVPMRQLPAP